MHIDIRKWPFLFIHEDTSSQTIGWIALGVMVVCGSTYTVFGKVLTGALSPLTLMFMSEVLTGFFVLLSFGAIPTLRKFLYLERSAWVPLVSIGLLSGVIGPLMLFVGLSRTTAINGTLFGNAEMVFLTLFAVIILKEQFHRIHALSIVTIITGMLVIALKGFSDGLTPQLGDIIITVACISYAAGGIVFRKYLSHIDPNLVILTRAAVAITTFFVISPFMTHPLIEEVWSFPLAILPALIGFAFLSKFLNLFSFYEAMERLPVTTISLSLNLPLVGSIAFSAWFLGEKLEMYHFIGGALIIAGAFMLELIGTHSDEKHLENNLRHGNMRSPT
jgi:drug/metabolite transporter (DMT)-like permease